METKPRIRVKMRRQTMVRIGGGAAGMFVPANELLGDTIARIINKIWGIEFMGHDGDYLKYRVIHGS